MATNPVDGAMTFDRADFEEKICERSQAVARVALLPRPIVLTNGVFDVLHRGHVTYLAQARKLGASLIVAVNSDASVRRLGKGAARPINHESDRAALLAPYELIDALHPDVLVKGGDYDMDRLAEAKLVRGWGGRAMAIPFVHERSTSATLRRIRAVGNS